jgi:hypothetical protein
LGKWPDRLTQDDTRAYQVYLLQERKLQAGTVGLHIAALRFFFCKDPPTSLSPALFTLPHELHTLILQNQAELYSLLFHAVAETLVEVARNPKHLGADIGFLGILHTWGQNMLFHPHVHCVIPGGEIAPDHRPWIRFRCSFFLPVKVLGKVFRGKFVAGLRKAYRTESLSFSGNTQHMTQPKHFAAFPRTLFRQTEVVYTKAPFGGPEQVLRYLGRYTHRVAISNHRLLSFDGSNVTFRWRDYAQGNKQKTMTIFRLHGQLATIGIHGTVPLIVGNGAGRSVGGNSGNERRRGCVPSVIPR